MRRARAQVAAQKVAAGEAVGLMFGRERNGLENDEVALADQIITLPVNPAFASLNLAQAVVIVAYEWFKHVSGAKLPFGMPQKSQAAPRQQLLAFFANLERELETVEFFRPPDKRETMQIKPAQHLLAHAADAAGHPDPERRDHRNRGGPQGPGARGHPRQRRGEGAARAACLAS
jgi:tRNA C32,U32 (ribose-2'-O)-methylase TrmJ